MMNNDYWSTARRLICDQAPMDRTAPIQVALSMSSFATDAARSFSVIGPSLRSMIVHLAA